MGKNYPIDPETGLAYEPEPGEWKITSPIGERREQVKRLIAEGQTPQMVSKVTGISLRTVYRYLQELKRG